MGELKIKCDHPQQLDIYVKRILARYLGVGTQILFQEHRDPVTGNPDGTKEPVTLYIDDAGGLNQYPVQCITEVILSLIDPPTNTIICNSKSRISITFKVFLLVKFQGVVAPQLIVLPDDIGTKVMTQYDLTLTQNINHNYPKETLQIVTDINGNTNFVYTADIPLSQFDNPLNCDELNDPTLQSHVLLKCLKWLVDVDGTGYNGTGTPPVLATTVALSIFEDILDKIGIDQDIFIQGIAEDFVCDDKPCC